jgi:hypothetical protein
MRPISDLLLVLVWIISLKNGEKTDALLRKKLRSNLFITPNRYAQLINLQEPTGTVNAADRQADLSTAPIVNKQTNREVRKLKVKWSLR